MDTRGVNSIAFKSDKGINSLKVCPIGNELTLSFPMWIDNYTFDRNKEGMAARHWNTIRDNPSIADSLINNWSEKREVVLRKIDSFHCNGNQVTVKDLYPGFKNYYCLFKTKNFSWKLCIVGSKSLKEYLATGENNKKESYLPLILVKSPLFRILNCI